MTTIGDDSLARHIGHPLICMGSGGVEGTIECISCHEVLLRFPVPAPPRRVDVSRWRATFAEGYDAEDIDRVLGGLAALGIHARCVWEYVDEYGPGGRSTLIGAGGGKLPEGLLAFLTEGEGDGLIDPHATTPPPTDGALDPVAASAFRSERGFNLALEDRRPATDNS